jgi:WD40 repeat protein
VDHSAVLQTSPKTVLHHPSAVKCILPLDHIITGSDDEDIRVWDGERCISVVSGHCDAITALRAWGGLVISASLDGTLRRWSMKELLQPTPLSFEERDTQDLESALTEEEERELEDLLTDDE